MKDLGDDLTKRTRRTDAALRLKHRATALQQAQERLHDALVFARDQLGEREHSAFVGYACALIAREASRHYPRDDRIGGVA